MKRKKKLIIAFLFVVFIAIFMLSAFTVSSRLGDKTVFNKGNVSGNTAGNLYNKGIFCEYDGKIYFSNSYDNGTLYVMNTDGTHIRKLSADTVSYINVAGKYIYYTRNETNTFLTKDSLRKSFLGIYRRNTNGEDLLTLDEESSGAVSLGNNTLFYQTYDYYDDISLKRVSIDGTEKEYLFHDPVNPSCIIDGIMYYVDLYQNNSLMSLDIESSTSSLLYEGRLKNPIYHDNYIYFMDLTDGSSLFRINLPTLKKEKLSSEAVDSYNLYGDYIYYQSAGTSNPRFYRMKKDGTERETILEGNFCNINVTSNFVYFNQFGYDTPIYKIGASGDINVTRFDEAADAIEP
ncbi:DUF5050 domain-containing protein [Konateibacter massiliensis]|uniref:DUF5050 domain-containing protein n=1 Tax=Konateibacter massiliensis TaxID=2002841 RepID=UPI0015D4A37F|nr:DUF5050 domain-containing protein [Konateibacter massiliensis]